MEHSKGTLTIILSGMEHSKKIKLKIILTAIILT
jgi:hypothetical protein